MSRTQLVVYLQTENQELYGIFLLFGSQTFLKILDFFQNTTLSHLRKKKWVNF